jgi:hypothetical protein
MKMAKASKKDIKAVQNFLSALEQISDHSFDIKYHTDEPDDVDKVILAICSRGRLDPWMLCTYFQKHVEPRYHRVTIGCDMLIDNACDPTSDTLDFRKDIIERIDLIDEMADYLSANDKNYIGSGSKFHQSLLALKTKDDGKKEG